VSIEILGLLVASAGASYGWWQLQRKRYMRDGRKVLEAGFDGDAQVVFSVAGHAMTSRGHPELWPVHLLYGLLQDESFTSAIKQLDGDPDAIESSVLSALDETKPDPASAAQAIAVLNRAYGIAQATGRTVSIIDLWSHLSRMDIASLVAVDPYELLFLLVHGMRPASLDMVGRTDVAVVLRNDNHTTFELVTGILQNVFELSGTEAQSRALETHTEGRTIIGRYKLPIARDKVIAARARARDGGYPLWIGLEDI
jgi:ATP-dependent Clp protease adapter protein ClpS